MKILIVDDHPIYIDGLKSFLSHRFKDLTLVEANAVDEALDRVDCCDFDLVLIDYNLPTMNGIGLLSTLVSRANVTPLVIISGEEKASIAKQALDLGAAGFIPKSLTSDELHESLDMILGGAEYIPKKLSLEIEELYQQELNSEISASDASVQNYGLTKRQLDVLRLLNKGLTNKEISRFLSLSPETVKEHMGNLFLALGVHNRTKCVAKAQELDLDLG